MRKDGGDKADQKPDDKARRLAEALRQNLRRRKAQARARTGEAKAAGRDADEDDKG